MKRLNGYKTKKALLVALRSASCNESFFAQDTMRFFGKQKFSIGERDGEPVLEVTMKDRTAVYFIEPETLKLCAVRLWKLKR